MILDLCVKYFFEISTPSNKTKLTNHKDHGSRLKVHDSKRKQRKSA